ncbi:unnamed protein product [Chrysoparadoxa australica]
MPKLQVSDDKKKELRDKKDKVKHSKLPYHAAVSGDEKMLVLALKTLGKFRLDCFCTLPFVQEGAVRYLSHDSAAVRKEAALTCCYLMTQNSRTWQPAVGLRGPSAVVIENVLSSLLRVAVSDPDPAIRHTLLSALDERFDQWLCQAHHLQTLLLLMGDEDFRNRLDAVTLLGRLASLNPAYLLPPLRKTLMQLLLELQYSSVTKSKEEATRLVSHFLRAKALQCLVPPFLSTLIETLPLQGGTTRLATASLEALGELVLVAKEDISPYLHRIIPLILKSIQDQSSMLKREVSLRTLGRLIGSTRYVIKPYLQYPSLLDNALAVLGGASNAPWSLRCEVLRTLGILGALDPHKYKQIKKAAEAQQSGADTAVHDAKADERRPIGPGRDGSFWPDDENSDMLEASAVMWELSCMTAIPSPSNVPPAPLTPDAKDYYPAVAVQALIRILRDTSLGLHHGMVTQAIMSIFRSLGLQCVPFLEHIFPSMLHVVRHCEAGLRESLLRQLGALVRIVRQHIRGFLSTIFELVVTYWDDHMEQVVPLAEEMALSVYDEFKAYVPLLLPLILTSLETLPRKPQHGLRLRLVLRSLGVLRPVLVEYVPVIVPALMRLIDTAADPKGGAVSRSESYQVRVTCIRALCQVTSHGALLQHPSLAARMILPLVRIIDSADPRDTDSQELTDTILEVFCVVATQLGPRFLNFRDLVDKALDGHVMTEQAVRYRQTADALAKRPHDAADSTVSNGAEMEALPDISQSPISPMQQEHEYVEYMEDLQGGGYMPDGLHSVPHMVGVKALNVNQQNLQRAWDVSQRSTRQDWEEWFRRASVEMLRESPSHALRSCAALSQAYQPLARELFQAAFVSCWFELSDQYQQKLVRSLEAAFQSSSIPPEILQLLLNLAEFMEHEVEALPINIRVLADLAQNCHAYAKALHYKELEFQTNPANCIENLISLNRKLGQPEAALGILICAQENLESVIVKESWLAKLGRWEEALQLYKDKVKAQPGNIAACIGTMKCMDALGEWEGLVEFCRASWDALTQPGVDEKAHKKAATMAARASWSLGRWDDFDMYAQEVEEDFVEGTYFRAVLAIHKEDYEKGAHYIDLTRRLLDNTFTALVAESYKRAYMFMVNVQELSELEEIMEYCKLTRKAEGVLMPQLHQTGVVDPDMMSPLSSTNSTNEVLQLRAHLIDKWRLRLEGCTNEVSVVQSILAARSLILKPEDDLQSWLQLAALCRQSGNFPLSRKVLTYQLGFPPIGKPDADEVGELQTLSPPRPSSNQLSTSPPNAYLKHLWAEGKHEEALSGMEKLASVLTPAEMGLKVRCLLKVGAWELQRADPEQPMSPEVQAKVFGAYELATQLEPDHYKAWHSWAMVCHRVVEQEMPEGGDMKRLCTGNSDPAKKKRLTKHLVSAAEGLIRAISLGKKKWAALVCQDMLNLLTIWYRYGFLPEVLAVLSSGLNQINLDSWLGVVPQLIARINIAHAPSRQLLHSLLDRLGKKHPQALVYSLSVALKSSRDDRREAAQGLMTSLQLHNPALVQEALMVSRELIRAAILWHEQWHEGLEEASRLYFGDGNVQGMLAILIPLHALLMAGAEASREEQFVTAFGRDLSEAYACIQHYQEFMQQNNLPIPTGRKSRGSHSRHQQHAQGEGDIALNQAWDLYYAVFLKINKQLPQMTMLELAFVSPQLLKAQDLELAVPGTYTVSGECVRIRQFMPMVQVIPSKQRPRKIVVTGEDGNSYVFLLKGHEDLRQDERVMQLFGQVNALLAKDRYTSHNDLSIQRYAVVPLSHNAGVVGWVPNCDTLHALIRDYR